MIKITNNIAELNAINSAQNIKEPNSQYCEVNKHCTLEQYAIPIMETILKSYNLDFITNNWLTTDIVETLSSDWTWHFTDNTIRLIVDKNKLTTDIINNTPVGQLMSYVLNDVNIKQHIIDNIESNKLYIYLKYIIEDHENIINSSDTIIIETL